MNCAASQHLLPFQKGETSFKENAEIIRHLETCEFCAAEVEFYSHFPQSEEMIASVDIPPASLSIGRSIVGQSEKEIFDA